MKIRNKNKVLFNTVNTVTGAGLIFLAAAMPVSATETPTFDDRTIGELSAGWWKWQEANYPDFSFGDGDVDCSLGQSGTVWYLGGTGGGSAYRICDQPIKGHKRVMFPLVNAAFYNPDQSCLDVFGDVDQLCTVEQKRELLDGIFSEIPAGIANSTACRLQAEVDDVPVIYSTPIVHTQSPTFTYAGDPETVAGGFWVVLPPLPSGEHKIHYTGGICDIDTGDVLFSVDVTYHLEYEVGDEDDDEHKYKHGRKGRHSDEHR